MVLCCCGCQGPVILGLATFASLLVISLVPPGSPTSTTTTPPDVVSAVDREVEAHLCQGDEDCAVLEVCIHRSLTCACNARLGRCSRDPRSGSDIGPDTCGQSRLLLSSWFMRNGSPNLLEGPVPRLVEPTAPDPYNDPSNPPCNPCNDPVFCAIKWSQDVDKEGRRFYSLANFPTAADAVQNGYRVTHQGHCGACSTLQDLGVYMSQNLTDPVRSCALQGTFSQVLMERCLRNLGFSEHCIPIWKFNMNNTKRSCLFKCLYSWMTDEPFNRPDGSLNDCLECDEVKSGPNFKYFAGRTRRNSGIPSSIYRPPETVYNISHCYWYGQL